MTEVKIPLENIQFHTEDIEFVIEHPQQLSTWLFSAIQQEGQQLDFLNFIFCSDTYLHKINLEYLQHDTLTDVITFPYSKEDIEGDIFISIDRIRENAAKYGVGFEEELHRVMIHGTLHLLGYLDKEEADQILMRQKEDTYLGLLHEMRVDP